MGRFDDTAPLKGRLSADSSPALLALHRPMVQAALLLCLPAPLENKYNGAGRCLSGGEKLERCLPVQIIR